MISWRNKKKNHYFFVEKQALSIAADISHTVYHTVCLDFSKLLGKIVVKYVSINTKDTLKKKDWHRTYM